MQSNRNVIIVWAWMLWPSDAAEHELFPGLGMDALVIARSRKLTLLWFGYGCSGLWMLSNMNVIMVSVWMLWSSDAAEHA